MSAPRIAVVIPYFQREAGLLQRTLASVAAQTHAPFQVVVVDDGSPRPAAEEITPQLRAALPQLTVVRQSNQGVAAARNAALEALLPEATAVALLDSDDFWTPSHLHYAAEALSQGGDFFFSNARVEDEPLDYFAEHPRLGMLYGSSEVAPGILRWSAGLAALFSAGCPFATPSVVFRRALLPQVRFPLNFRRAGEDQVVFWQLLTRGALILFCTEVTVIIGRGLGTWRSATLGTRENLIRLADEIHLRRHVLRQYRITGDDRRLMRGALNDRRSAAVYSTLHLLRRRHNVIPELLYLFRTDPISVVWWPLALPKTLYRWTRAKLHPRPASR
jgi:succinoglycan biosynthesis protein ExoW